MKRDDLQGIRGLAIVAVLAFHFFPKLFPNGYIGVDIFFVLSGFLMTMIFGSKPITSDSISQFYFRRAKRILPLYLLIVLLGSIAVFLVFPSTFVSMNMDSAWNSIFLYHNMAEHSDDNMYFKMLNQAEDIFTHTWSLCVEMQFYLLAPFIFVLLSFCSTALMLTFFHVVIILTSLGNHLLATEQVAFNSVFCRVWQFLIGSAVFFLSAQLIEMDTRVKKNAELLLEENDVNSEDEEADDAIFTKPRHNVSRSPLYFVLWTSLAFLTVNSFAPWTFPTAFLRITSTTLSAFVILSGTLCEVNPMKNRLLVYIGDISYSLYLVHWPIYVFVKHYYENQTLVYFLAIAVSVLLAIAISESFEKWYLKLGKQEVVLMILVFYLAILSIQVNSKNIGTFVENWKYGSEEKVVESFHNSFENVTLEQAIILNKKWAREEYKNLVIPNCFPNKSEHGFCEFGREGLGGNFSVFMVGNSLTPNLGPLVFKSFGRHANKMYKYSNSYCEVLALVNEKRCGKSQNAYIEEVSKKLPDVLFILTRPDKLSRPVKGTVENDEIFKEALKTLRKYENIVKKRIYILESYTPPKNLPLSRFGKMLENGRNVTQSLFQVDFSYKNALQRQEELVKRCSKCELIRISDVLFDGNNTKSYDEKTKLGYYYDGLHITPFAMNLIYPVFKKISDSFQ